MNNWVRKIIKNCYRMKSKTFYRYLIKFFNLVKNPYEKNLSKLFIDTKEFLYLLKNFTFIYQKYLWCILIKYFIRMLKHHKKININSRDTYMNSLFVILIFIQRTEKINFRYSNLTSNLSLWFLIFYDITERLNGFIRIYGDL